MSKLKLGVFGDSYADIVHPPPIELNLDAPSQPDIPIQAWPIHLSNLLSATLECYALCGTSLWWSYKNFLKHYKEVDVVVFVYTNYNRWNTLVDEYQYLSNTISKTDEKRVKLSVLGSKSYRVGKLLIKSSEILFDEQFNIFTFQSIFDDVNLRCKSDGKVLINVMPFENEICIDVSKKSGSIVNSIIDVSVKENQHCDRFVDVWERYKGDGKHCHLNSNNNYVLATLIQEVMNKNDIVKLIDDPRISYDPKYLDHIVLG